MYNTKTTFNKLEVGEFFTFRKNGDVNFPHIENECYKVDDCIIIDGIEHRINVRDLSGGASYVKNKRSVVWTEQ